MSHQYADKIYIITETQERGEEIKASVTLRGFDRVKVLNFDKAAAFVKVHPPDLLIIDSDETMKNGLNFLKDLSDLPTLENPPAMIMLAERFDEETFLTCYDAGAKDFLIKPVNHAYLLSRVLLALEEARQKEKLEQRDAILRELSVITSDSNVFSTEYFFKLMKRHIENRGDHSVSLLILKLEGLNEGIGRNPTYIKTVYRHVAEVLKRACRATDWPAEYFEGKFAVLMPNTRLEGGRIVSQRIFQQLNGATIYFNEGNTLTLSVSLGVADFSGCLTYEDLLNKALDGLKLASETDQKIQYK